VPSEYAGKDVAVVALGNLLDGNNVIDFPIILRDLSRYDEMLS